MKIMFPLPLAAAVLLTSCGALARDGETKIRDAVSTLDAEEFVQKAWQANSAEIDLAQTAMERTQNPGVKKFAREIFQDHTRANAKLNNLAEQKGILLAEKSDGGSSYTNAFDSAAEKESAVPEPPENENTNRDDRLNSDTVPNPSRVAESDTKRPPDIRVTENNSPAETSGDETTATTNNPPRGDRRGAARAEGKLTGDEFDAAFAHQVAKDHAQAIALCETAAENLDDAELRDFAKKMLLILRDHWRKAQELSEQIGVQPEATRTTEQP